ncbi:MAG: 4-(cytidine 5'-diphospho)-2-C-methyl-D-erythritol kinase [Armatimonadetes bacterium]|nr:4-(cytidine 5'-diphospho)-2-C-methyl-D-erythritol kinase [Armatimonadota bacterium]
MHLLAPAKLNLALRVGPRRADGFHDLDSVFQAIGLHDTVSLDDTPGDGEIRVTCSDPALPCDERNTARRAAALLREPRAPGRGVRIHLEKRIPAEAGLGGGSSDAAAVLLGLNRLWRLNLPREALLPLAAAVGSDVPFFLWGGCARVRGRGERVEPLPHRPALWFAVVRPAFGVSTARAYADLDRVREEHCNQSSSCSSSSSSSGVFESDRSRTRTRTEAPEPLLAALARGNAAGVGRALRSDLEGPVIAAHPEIARLKQELVEAGAEGALMSGSGSAVFGVFGVEEEARAAAAALAARWPWAAAAPAVGGER